MNPDELQSLWAERNRRLERDLRLNRALVREVQLGGARAALGRLSIGLGVEFAIDALVVLWLGDRLAADWGALRFLVPTAALFVAWTAFLALSLRQLLLAERVDYGAPIAVVQRQVEELRLARLRGTRARLLTAPLLWAPILIVVLRAFFGADAYETPGGFWIAVNVGVGAVLVPLLYFAGRLAQERPATRSIVERFQLSLSGRCIARAEERLAALAEYEREPL